MRKLLFLPILILPAIGCANVPVLDSGLSVVCERTEIDRKIHAGNLARGGDAKSVISGARLIAKIDAACGEFGGMYKRS